MPFNVTVVYSGEQKIDRLNLVQGEIILECFSPHSDPKLVEEDVRNRLDKKFQKLELLFLKEPVK